MNRLNSTAVLLSASNCACVKHWLLQPGANMAQRYCNRDGTKTKLMRRKTSENV